MMTIEEKRLAVESEKSLERHLTERVKAIGGESIKLTAQYHRGLPDRLVLLPGGRAVFAELKSTGCRPTRLQNATHAAIRALGFEVAVIDNSAALDAFINKAIKDKYANL